MTTSDEILILANQLANDGKKPTVALIKGKLSKPTPLPTIIAILKSWQHDENFTTLPNQNKNKNQSNNIDEDDPSNGEIYQTLNNELQQMKQEIIELKGLVKSLIEDKK